MTDIKDRLKDYIEVNVRIEKFWQKYPNGRIITEIVRWQDETIVMKCDVYKDIADSVPSATGHAYEVEGSSYINKTSALENCETSVVGRALAILGFEIKKAVASKEEVANAINQQENPRKQDPDSRPTDKQRKRLYALMKTHNVEAQKALDYYRAQTGKTSSKEMTVSEYDALCKWIESQS